MNLVVIISIVLAVIVAVLMFAWIRHRRFFNDVIIEKWGPGIANFIGKALIAGFMIWGANYYYHNVFIFNQNKAVAFKTATREFALLRTNINKLSALVKMRESGKLKSITEKEFQKEIKNTVKNIVKHEVAISNITDLPYYFGERISRKQHNFISWTNYTTIEILKKKYCPPDKITDTLYYSINYSMMLQLYSSHKCKRCKVLAKMSDPEILKRYETAHLKKLLAGKHYLLPKLTYEKIIFAKQLANNFR